ncbi:hypothetical protein MF406_13475 [Georgenia sp. TF02-10]|uniref:hypothetical protein n=1 Tax=Georgenia sp. TF02-10 TaxID=2917725 RepID=UPI001FA6E2D1|nr:hypothetical protein [Georgenia sp. TF02-10]UNX53966.1 hypothetical protein MF406_13475 [Georgenia sp. TF02-10]
MTMPGAGIPSRRTTSHVTRRIIAVALVVLGAVGIALAIASATVWRPADTATLTMPARSETPVVITDAGVLDAVAPDVTITARADDDEPVVLALGRTEDVEAWVGEDPHARITGLSSWEELTVRTEAGEAAADDGEGDATAEATEGAADGAATTVPNPAGSDLWVVEQDGTGTAELTWTDQPGRWSLLAATDGSGPAPRVSLTWPVEVTTPWLVPGVIVGAVVLLAGLALLALEVLTVRETRRRDARVAERAAAGEDATTVLPATSAGLTRRERREQERTAAGRGRRPATGEVPAAPVRPTDDAGTARGAGIVPATSRAAQLRPTRADHDGQDDHADGARTGASVAQPVGAGGSGSADRPREAGPSRGAGIVPASTRAAEFRRARDLEPTSAATAPAGTVTTTTAEPDAAATAELDGAATDQPTTATSGQADGATTAQPTTAATGQPDPAAPDQPDAPPSTDPDPQRADESEEQR